MFTPDGRPTVAASTSATISTTTQTAIEHQATIDDFGETIKSKETDKGIALFSLPPRMDVDNIGVDSGVIHDVIARTIASKKGRNVNIVTATFDALPADVQKTTKDQYGEKTARKAKGVFHGGKVYIIAENN